MKVIASEKTREMISTEYHRFMDDPNNLARLKMKLSTNQRSFIEAFQEAYKKETSAEDVDDRLLLFQESMLMFSISPELVPNAPIELMRKKIKIKNTTDDFEQLILMIKVWRNSINKAKRPINRMSVFLARRNKFILYPIFVVALALALTSILNLATYYFIYNGLETRQLAMAIVAGFVSVAAGKGIIVKFIAANIKE